jgi:hypothetical protein
MLFNVPQYIDVEDKVAGPFTVKQLLWMFGMGAVLLILYGTLEKVYFFISALPVIIIFCGLAFYRPHGQPLIRFIFWGISFVFQPKVYIWRRGLVKEKKEEKIENHGENNPDKKRESQKNVLSENIEAFARTLDTEGKERNEKMMEIINQNRNKKK